MSPHTMQHDTDQDHQGAAGEIEGEGALTLAEYTLYCEEIEQQAAWRANADKEMDYADGNQLDTELLRAQQERGIPPAKEDLIGPALLALQGYEATIRTDWRVTPNGQPGGQDTADALNFKLNEAERHSKADRACSDAFRPQIAVGLGWVEVAKESDPFKYPFRCTAVHRNEIHWDTAALEDDLSDARYLRRQRWMQPGRLARTFPQHRELIQQVGKHGSGWWASTALDALEGGASTRLQGQWHDAARGWTVTEDRWYNPLNKEVCVSELWYRRWVDVGVLTMPDGRVVEYDEGNPAHNYAIATGTIKFTRAVVARVRRSYWLGPHLLHDGPTPYSHDHFPYVPFWGFREDSTRVPYGYVRGLIYQQDSLNSGIATLRWGMGAVRTERTKGAVAMTDAQFRKQVARRDADIILDAQHMAQQGARFEVKRDYELTQQHFQLLDGARAAIERISAAPSAFAGRDGSATSGLQEQTQLEQANQSLGRMMDNFRRGRTQVGEMLLSLIVDELGSKEEVVVIEGDAVTQDRTVTINKPETDPAGYAYLSNDLQRTTLMVALEDVPATASYRGQQLNAMSEAIKSLPAQFQAAAMPFLASLMDVPFRRELVEALRAAAQQESPEGVEKRIQKAVQEALAKAGNELKEREIAIKERKADSEVRKIDAESVSTGVTSTFAAMQAAEKIAMNPLIAPVGDVVMQKAGWREPTPQGQDPDIPIAEQPVQVQEPGGMPGDTSPLTPQLPMGADVGANEGIETLRTD